MNWKRLVVFAFLALTAMPVASAQAYWRVGVGIGVPVYRPCYRVYVGPSLYVAPAPVYVQPVPVVVQPAPVVQPVYPAPARPGTRPRATGTSPRACATGLCNTEEFHASPGACTREVS